MEPTNELITKSEAYAEGFSVVPNNECMTKAEFVAKSSISILYYTVNNRNNEIFYN